MGKTDRKKTGDSATGELPHAAVHSAVRKIGRRLILKFVGEDRPELDRIEFRFKESTAPVFWQRGDDNHGFVWTEVPQAFSILFLDYLWSASQKSSEPFFFRGAKNGSHAASLGDAIHQPKHRIHELFIETFPSGGTTNCVRRVFNGDNLHGKANRERRVSVKSDFLPPDCVEVFWGERGPLVESGDVQLLANRIRESLGIIRAESPPTASEKVTDDSLLRMPTTPGPQQPVGDRTHILGDGLATQELEKKIARLELETDSELVAREAVTLIADCEYLIHTRTSQQNTLQTARRTLEAVTRVARIKLDLASDIRLRQQWAELIISGLADLAACHNHIGSVGHQDDIEAEISEVLAKNSRLLPGSFVQKAELLHEIKVRTLNKLFNDYRFKQAASRLECEIQDREQLIPSGVADELLGKMLGSIGQAYAFISRTEADKSDQARKYLEKSLVHFEPGTYFHSMSVNFLATLAWQEGNLDLACQTMSRHTGLQQLVSAEEFGSKFWHYFFQENMSAFDVVNYARILGRLCEAHTINIKYLREVVNYWNGRLLDEHPHEQLAKWLAYALFRSGDVGGAIKLCNRGVTISRKLEFTVQTIELSILGLLSACHASQKNTAPHLDSVAEFDSLASNLVGRSASFRDYLGNFGGVGGLHDWLKNPTADNVANITRFLPFTYA